jgi:hypothetical protein
MELLRYLKASLGALALAGFVVGCDQGSAKISDGMKGPPPKVKWHYPPTTGATNGTIRVQFDRFLASDIANHDAFCVSRVNSEECLTGANGFTVEYDPVDRVVVLKPPAKGLDVGMYKVRVLAPGNAGDTTGVRAFDGVPMAEEVSWGLTVDASTMAQEPNRKLDFCSAEQACQMPTDPKPGPDLDSVNDLVQGCAGSNGCHVPSPGDKSRTGEALLLSIGEDAGGVPAQVRRLIAEHQVAPQTATDPDPGQARKPGEEPFGRNMPFIDPGQPGNSYILYKMIIGMLVCGGGGAVDPSACTANPDKVGFTADSYGPDGGACTDSILHKKGDPKPNPVGFRTARGTRPSAASTTVYDIEFEAGPCRTTSSFRPPTTSTC